jgi:hypothetical protein
MSAPVTMNLQGIPINPEGVNPTLFFARTRRKRAPEFVHAYSGLGGVDNVPIRKSDILAAIRVRFSGSLVITTATGAAATTAQWPYGLIKNAKLTANGQTNLIDCSGIHLKAREYMVSHDLNDRGVVRSVSNVNVQQGTFSKNTENWGVGQGQTAIPAGTYPVELDFLVPVAEDEKDLAGAIFCQTSTMDITLALAYANLADLFTLTGTSTATLNGNLIVETEKYSIPIDSGVMIVPDLSNFHSIVQTNTSALSNGENQVRLIGQGAGKALLRLWARFLNGAPAAPLAVNAVNFGQQSWMYGTNERPETYQDGQSLRDVNEFTYANDIASVWGIYSHEFALVNTFRDVVDMGQTSELRLSTTIQNGVVLTTPTLEYVQETVFSAAS